MVNGSIPADGGNLLMTPDERNNFLKSEPKAEMWLRHYLGAEGFINGIDRYCLWLADCPPDTLRQMPHVLQRIDAVRKARLDSPKAPTKAKAETPTLFTENRQPTNGFYLAFPRTSSENRRYIPLGFLSADTIAANDLQMVPNASLFHFGVLTSTMHMAWMRITSGRLESRYRYSSKATYNNFPWPEAPSDAHRQRIEDAAQGVLDARAAFPGTSLATLYNPETMPPALVKAHTALDRAVDAAYVPDGGAKTYANDAARVAFLFRRYAELTSLV